jgi:preprotein translocase subunit SecE
MARLQRKKTSSAKKKPDNPNAGTDANKASGLAGKIAVGGSGAKTATGRQVTHSKKSAPPTAKESNNIFNRAAQFLREVKVELKKVTWPSRKQTIGSTAVVIVIVLIISLFLGLVDIGLSSFIRVILQ